MSGLWHILPPSRPLPVSVACWQWLLDGCFTGSSEYLRAGPSGCSRTCSQSSESPWRAPDKPARTLPRSDTKCGSLWVFCNFLSSFFFFFSLYERQEGSKYSAKILSLCGVEGRWWELYLYGCLSFKLESVRVGIIVVNKTLPWGKTVYALMYIFHYYCH